MQVRVKPIFTTARSPTCSRRFRGDGKYEQREIISVKAETAPFKPGYCCLMSRAAVDNYVTFYPEGGEEFCRTVSPEDRISIVTLNEDVKVLSGLRPIRQSFRRVSTALTPAVERLITIRWPMPDRHAQAVERGADGYRGFVDGADNHLSYRSILARSIQESGALIDPLYVALGL